MFCEKCGKELREGVKFCTGCGSKIDKESVDTQDAAAVQQGNGKLIVYGYTQWFLWRPKVDIMKNGVKIGEVNPDSKVEIAIDENCMIQFRCSMRTATMQAFSEKTQTVQLSFNRITGELLIDHLN